MFSGRSIKQHMRMCGTVQQVRRMQKYSGTIVRSPENGPEKEPQYCMPKPTSLASNIFTDLYWSLNFTTQVEPGLPRRTMVRILFLNSWSSRTFMQRDLKTKWLRKPGLAVCQEVGDYRGSSEARQIAFKISSIVKPTSHSIYFEIRLPGTHQAGRMWPDLLSAWRQSHLLHSTGAAAPFIHIDQML